MTMNAADARRRADTKLTLMIQDATCRIDKIISRNADEGEYSTQISMASDDEPLTEKHKSAILEYYKSHGYTASWSNNYLTIGWKDLS